MSDSSRTVEDVRMVLKSRRECEPQDIMTFYDKWGANYEKDLDILDYQGPNLVADFISSNFSGSREEARVLDVACGPGRFAKVMSDLGFRHFVGIDCSKGMLEEAVKTGLYEDLRLANLGSEPLPAQAGMFDVVAMIGALQPHLVPFSVLRELCHVTKPGGLICLTKTQHRTDSKDSTVAVERELQLLEEEGLWTCTGIKKSDRYMKDTSVTDREDTQDESFISGTLYLFRKPLM
ncbi:methyltransferase-like protein 27 [Enoplosus armatus]|uniref:methyltransferase-like protein 27 n=1 Tax=Enoplosus armatus TaxID=215367 RepID=UPI003993C803